MSEHRGSLRPRAYTALGGFVSAVIGWRLAVAPEGTAARDVWPWLLFGGAPLCAVMLWSVLKARGPHRLWTGVAGVALVVVAVRMAMAETSSPVLESWPYLALVGVGLLVALAVTGSGAGSRGGGGVVSELFSGSGSSGTVRKWASRSRRNDGVASRTSILKNASGWAMRSRAGVLRPSLAGRRGVRAVQVATEVARVGWLRVWSPIEDVTLRLGGPRMGKTGELACRVLDAPGAVIATSTRTDLYEMCAKLRGGYQVKWWFCLPAWWSLALEAAAVVLALQVSVWAAASTGVAIVLVVVPWVAGTHRRVNRRVTGRVYVFNPSVMAGLASTVGFNPLSGCREPMVAITRAGDLIDGAGMSGGDSGDREFWAAQAKRALSALMHAAALGGKSMRDVQGWIANPKDSKKEVMRFLAQSPEPSFETAAEQFLTTNDKTQSSITTTIMPALGWLADKNAYATTQTSGDGSLVELDVAALLAERAVVFMIGAEEAQTAPLVTALTAHIAREARRIAASMPSGRLDPPLTLVLDEAALICSIPLDRWTADMGGRNVTIHIAAQSYAQLVGRWGQAGAAAILNNCASVLVYGNHRDPSDLNTYSLLSGERFESVTTTDEHGRVTSMTSRGVPVVTPAQIAQFPKFRVMIIRTGMATMIGRARMLWTRPDGRAMAREKKLLKLLGKARTWADMVAATGFGAWLGARWAEAVNRVTHARADRRARRGVEAAQARAKERL